LLDKRNAPYTIHIVFVHTFLYNFTIDIIN
jgi:hypothetical protein